MKRILVLLILMMVIQLFSSIEPLDFEPGLRELTEADWQYLEGLPRLSVEDIKRERLLPASVDNSTQEWMRPIFNQDGGSCGQASGIGYCFTYEIDRLRGVSADTEEHQYADHYTWNYLNGGFGNGSWFFDGWKIVEAGGCPSVATYGGMFYYGQTGWMNGYENYRSAMENRIEEIITIEVDTPEGLEVLKHWFYDHGNDEESGGVVCFGAGVSDLEGHILPSQSSHAGEYIIADWTMPVNHAMTFVGYDDSVRYDYNGDGMFTNDIDINNDGAVDMRDWETGALKMANSWGSGWANEGYIWVMYRTLAEPTETGGIWANLVQGIKAKASYEPLLTLQTELSHDKRNTLRIGAGASGTAGAIEPEAELFFPHFNFQGGELNLPGNSLPGEQPLEIGLDVTPLLGEIEPEAEMKWWLIVESADPENNGSGTMLEYIFIDETGEETNLLTGSQSNWSLINNWTNLFEVSGEIDFEPVEIITEELPEAVEGSYYEAQLTATGGFEPLEWQIKQSYNESLETSDYPAVNWQEAEMTDNDDGYAVIELPFPFYFYNTLIQSVTMLTDGSLIFDDSFIYIRSEESLKNERCITPYGADLMAYPEYGDGFYYYLTDNYAQFRWHVSKFNEPEFEAEFAIALSQGSQIDFFYDGENMTASDNWISGVSLGDNISYNISEISGSYNLPVGEKLQIVPEPYPGGEFAIDNEGLLSGIFMDVTHFANPYQFHIICRDDYGISDEKVLDMWIYSLAEDTDNLPVAADLSQNYPNPFVLNNRSRGITTISYQLAWGAEVSLQIYNLKGQRVKTLISEYQDSGFYEIDWDGRGENNREVAAGMYFYKLKAEDQTLTRKLLLLK